MFQFRTLMAFALSVCLIAALGCSSEPETMETKTETPAPAEVKSEEAKPLTIGLILVVDRVLDMCRTSVNVFSDSCAAVTIARLEGEKTKLVS